MSNGAETQLAQLGEVTINAAAKIAITDNRTYEAAADFLKEIKSRAKRIAEYWKPLKDKAAAAHKDIVAREKTMLEPLTRAEATVKTSMTNYQLAVEAERRRVEEEARRKQQEERERLLSEAVAAEESQDHVGAAVNMAMAEMVEDMPGMTPIVAAPAASGISTRRTWKARVVDPTAVPAYLNGIELRTINESALNQMARLTKGTAVVPGVEFYEDTTIAVR